jgi:integrating conjugative element protein (TIGR03759 family)
VSSRAIQSRAQLTAELALDTRLARDWGLKPEEWARYRQLMAGPLGILSPRLDPLTALGIEARSQAEREHYAELEVHMEGERVAKLLAYQRAYDAAWKRLYPRLEPVEFAAVPQGPLQIADASISKRLAVFVKEPCAACDAMVKALQARGRPIDIYMVGLEDDAQLRAWAARLDLDPGEVRSGTITLNHDDGRWLAIGDASSLPAVLTQVNGQWQRE